MWHASCILLESAAMSKASRVAKEKERNSFFYTYIFLITTILELSCYRCLESLHSWFPCKLSIFICQIEFMWVWVVRLWKRITAGKQIWQSCVTLMKHFMGWSMRHLLQIKRYIKLYFTVRYCVILLKTANSYLANRVMVLFEISIK